MSKNYLLILVTGILLLAACTSSTHKEPSMGTPYATSQGNVYIYPVGHASLMLSYQGMVIHIDPFGAQANYDSLPKADLVLLTHEHPDHFDRRAIEAVRTNSTRFIGTQVLADSLPGMQVLANGDQTTWQQLSIEAVPAYNQVHMRPDGTPYHPKGRGNGYLITIDTLVLYIAGDTEDIPEMAALASRNIQVAFLPKNLPYTMSDSMWIHAARMVAPKQAYVYHYFEIDQLSAITDSLASTGIQVQAVGR